ncbi:MAG: LysR family transcriptional regulator [Gammaproteobacteria bacterium]
MDLRLLRAFAIAVELGSINRAAAKLGCSQPSLSAQIRQLERELGTALLVRMSRGVTPTAAGREVYGCATDVLARVEDTLRALSGWADGSLRAGIIPTLSKGLLPRILPDFTARHPRLELRIVEAYTGTLIDGVLAEELDLAIGVMPRREPSLQRQRLGHDELVLIGGRAAGLGARAPVDLAALPPQKLVMPSVRHSLRATIDRLIDNGTLAVSQAIEIDGLLGTLQFLRHSDFIALLPRMTVADEIDDPMLDVAAIATPLARFDYALVHRRQSPLSPAARDLVARLAAGMPHTRGA